VGASIKESLFRRRVTLTYHTVICATSSSPDMIINAVAPAANLWLLMVGRSSKRAAELEINRRRRLPGSIY